VEILGLYPQPNFFHIDVSNFKSQPVNCAKSLQPSSPINSLICSGTVYVNSSSHYYTGKLKFTALEMFIIIISRKNAINKVQV